MTARTSETKFDFWQWLQIVAVVVGLVSGPFLYFFSRAALAERNQQHNEYQDERLKRLEDAVQSVPELVVEVRHLVRRGNPAPAPAPHRAPGAVTITAADPPPAAPRNPSELNREVEELIRDLRRRRERSDDQTDHGSPPPQERNT